MSSSQTATVPLVWHNFTAKGLAQYKFTGHPRHRRAYDGTAQAGLCEAMWLFLPPANRFLNEPGIADAMAAVSNNQGTRI